MADPTIIILGGYGNTGRALARLMLAHSRVRLVLAGRNEARAQAAADELNQRFPGKRVRGIAADAGDRKSLLRAFKGAKLVVAASSTSPVATVVAEAALEAGLDYLDPQFSRAKVAALQKMAARIQAAGRCFITDAGFHPGLPAALVRFAAARFDRLQTANVGSVIQIDWRSLEVSPSTIDELVTEFRDFQSLHYKDGRWRPMGWVESFRPVWMTFGRGFGRRYTMPMFLEELRPLPDLIPGLEETGFFVGGFNWFVDWVLMPLGMAWMAVAPKAGGRAFGRMLVWGLRKFSAPPYGTLLMLEARGIALGATRCMRVSVFHPDGYVLTAAPMAACLLQMLDGTARRPGLHLQALAVDPQRLLADLQRMGVSVDVWGPAPPPLPAPYDPNQTPRIDTGGRSETVKKSVAIKVGSSPNIPGGMEMTGYVGPIEKETLKNKFFRRVLFTGLHAQLVVMCLQGGEEIGNEVHLNVDQFFRIEEGKAKFVFNGSEEHKVKNGEAVVVPAGTYHNVINASKSEPLKLYTIYTPPQHPDGTIHKTKAEAEAAEHH